MYEAHKDSWDMTMPLPDLRRIARIAMARCTREAKFEALYDATLSKYINLIFCYVI